MPQKTDFKAFTLVELIVVIVILGILSTIGFVSYNGYLAGARDSNRISALKGMTDSLNLYATKNTLPFPEDYTTITASGAVIGYQGYVGNSLLEIINYTSGGKDPKDDTYYTYYLSGDKKNIQLLAFIEETENLEAFGIPLISQSYAVDYTNRFPKVYGKKLGVLTQTTTNIPLQELSFPNDSIDIITSTDSFTVYLSDTEKISGTGSVIAASIPNGSCKRIKESGGSRGDNIYTINPGGSGELQVFCDMSTDGGGFIKYFKNERELVLGYNFEKNTKDFSQNKNNGNMTSGNPVFGNGIVEKGILFSGGPFISVLTSPSLNFTTNQYTMSFWVNFSVELSAHTQEYPTIINKRPWCTAGYIFHFTRTSNNASTHICENNTTKGLTSTTFPSLVGKWTHFVGLYDGTKFELYINGKLNASNIPVNPILSQSPMNMNIGSDYQGLLDSLRIYNRALSISEIQALYREGL